MWNHCFRQQQRGALPDLFGIELVELRLLAVAPPQTQHLGLGAVGHVDELLVPPALVDRADVAAQDYAVVAHLRGDFSHSETGASESFSRTGRAPAHLHEEDVACGVCAGVHNERLLLDVTAPAGPDGKLAAVLETQRTIRNEERRLNAANSRGEKQSPCRPVCPESH